MKLTIDPQRAIDDLRALSKFGQLDTGVNRLSLSPEDVAARRWLLERMREAGLDAAIDEIGTVRGRTPGCEKYVAVGSHTDTVPKGGWLDGSMGVIFGLEVARGWMESGQKSKIGIEVLSFSDEEGHFSGFAGSKTFVGELAPKATRSLRNPEGKQLGSLVDELGWSNTAAFSFDKTRHCCYLEAHIEQGPVLEEAGIRLGVVTGIAGMERLKILFHGRPEHAGTIPMRMRSDAAAALFSFATEFRKMCERLGGTDTVWNLGGAEFDPGAFNVVCGLAELFVEFRDAEQAVINDIRGQVAALATSAANSFNVSVEIQAQSSTKPALMDEELMHLLEVAAGGNAEQCMRMPSGAGHDAMLLAPHIPTGMLFVPSINGRSHDVSEDTAIDDMKAGLVVFADAVGSYIASAT